MKRLDSLSYEMGVIKKMADMSNNDDMKECIGIIVDILKEEGTIMDEFFSLGYEAEETM